MTSITLNTLRMLSNSSRNVAKMSAAGSGKTYDICKEALERARNSERVLITTYTNRGAEAVRKEIRKQNDGVLDSCIVVKTWFTFILSDMIKPYQVFLTKEIGGVRSLDYSQTYGVINYAKKGTKRKYITEGKNVRSNEAASLVILLNQLSRGLVINRIEDVYRAIFFDEIQDLAGDDIEIIQLLINSSTDVICCGDNKQATFRTHNAKKNKALTGKNIWSFFEELEKKGVVEVERNLSSRRFNSQICEFANSVFPVGEPITTLMNEKTEHDGIFMIGSESINLYQQYFASQVLRYDVKAETYGYAAVNFGACKGETFDRIIIIPNGPLKKFLKNKIPLDNPEKYYVAVTRARYSITFVLEELPNTIDGYAECYIECGNERIRALKYIIEEEY